MMRQDRRWEWYEVPAMRQAATWAQAIAIVERWLAAEQERLVIHPLFIQSIQQWEHCWIVQFNTQRIFKNGKFKGTILGAVPIALDKEEGILHHFNPLTFSIHDYATLYDKMRESGKTREETIIHIEQFLTKRGHE